MNWKLAIEINREALTRIVAGLVTWLEAFEGVLRLPRPIYQSLGLSLHKTESALRRLIVIAARGLVVSLAPSRPMPEGLVIKRKDGQEASWRSFPLIDSRINYRFDQAEALAYHSHYMDDAALHAKFKGLLGPLAVMPASEVEAFSSEAETKSLHLRLAAAQRALKNLSAQAKRMARWQARRKLIENPKFISPIRLGPPPGNRRKSKAEIDLVLRECHGLAFDALKLDSS